MDIISKTRQDYNKIAHHFSGTRYDTWPELMQFKPLIKNGQYIMDWGCGNARLFLMLKNYDIKYFGVDISDELLKIAKTKHANFVKAGKAKFFCTAKKDKVFKPNFFDLVFMVASFHHLPTTAARLKLLKKIYKELKPGGKLIMTVWNLQSNWAKAKQKKDWKKIKKNDWLVPWKTQQGEVEVMRYYHHFTIKELGGLLTKAGFKILKLDFYNNNNWTDSKGGRNLVAVAVKR